MIKIYAVFADDKFKKTMSIHTMEKPAEFLESIGAICLTHSDFFKNHAPQISDDDIAIFFPFAMKDEDLITKIGHLRCRKFLRNIDSCKSDRILFKSELTYYERCGFEAMLVTYCTDYNINFLFEKGIKAIGYPHLMDFSTGYNILPAERQFDILVSGQLSEKSYPTRTRLANLFMKNQSKYNICYLPHPGHMKSQTSHQYFGENYVKLASNCKLGIVCTGDDDSLVLKYLEFTRSSTLPVGDAPSNMPIEAKNSMILVDKNMSDDDILSKVDEVLKNHDVLSSRIKSYQQAIATNFDIRKTADILKNIIEGKYDKQ